MPSPEGIIQLRDRTMHIARLKQRDLGRTDFTSIRIVPVHGFMKKSDYSCTVTMHVQKNKKLAVGLIVHPTAYGS